MKIHPQHYLVTQARLTLTSRFCCSSLLRVVIIRIHYHARLSTVGDGEYVCARACTHVWGCLFLCAHMRTPEDVMSHELYHSLPFSLKGMSLSELELFGQAASSSDPPVLTYNMRIILLVYAPMPRYLCGCCGIKLRFSCMHSKCFY